MVLLLYNVVVLIGSVLLLALMVLVHELGHYGAARCVGFYPKRVSIGFGRMVCVYTDKHGTAWQWRAWLVGGFVDLFGTSRLPDEKWQRLSHVKQLFVLLAGVTANALFALLALITLYATGSLHTVLKVQRVTTPSSAHTAGLLPGDILKTIEDKRVHNWRDVVRTLAIQSAFNASSKLNILRQGKKLTLTLPAVSFDAMVGGAYFDELGIIPVHTRAWCLVHVPGLSNYYQSYVLAVNGEQQPPWRMCKRIQLADASIQYATLIQQGAAVEISARELLRRQSMVGYNFNKQSGYAAMTFLGAIEQSFSVARDVLAFQIIGFWRLATGHANLQTMAGPIRILEHTATTLLQGSGSKILQWIAYLNLALVCINLLPIPALDGGQCIMVLYQAVTGKVLSKKLIRVLNVVSFFMMIFVLGYAIAKELLDALLRVLWHA